MAQVFADDINQIAFAGQHGNYNVIEDGKTLAAFLVADTVDLMTIPARCKIDDFHLINAALGAAVTLSLGWRYKDGTAGGSATALMAATAMTAAARTNMAVAPVLPSLQKEIVVYGTGAGATAAGRIDLVVRYRALGGK